MEKNIKYKSNILLPILFLLLATTIVSCKEVIHNNCKSYYFNPTLGNNINSGLSSNAPFKSLNKLKEISLRPGDKIFLAAGETFTNPLILKNVSGAAGRPILVSNYSLNNDEALAHIKTQGDLNGILIENCSFIEIQNLSVSANPIENKELKDKQRMRCGVLVETTVSGNYEHIYLNNLLIKDVFYEKEGSVRSKGEVKTANGTQNYGWGIRFINNTKGALLKNIKVTSSTIENVAHTGIKLTSRKSDKKYGIQGFKIFDTKVLRTGGPGIQMSGVRNGHIYNNIVDQSGSNDDTRKWGRGSGLWTWGATDILIEKNRFTNANGPGDSVGAHIDFNCNNVVLQYNFSANNAGGFCEILGNNYNCAYRYNISVNDGYRVKRKNRAFQEGKTFWLSGFSGEKKERKGPFNSYFYNNTIYVKNDILAKVAVDRISKGILIANNIFYIEGEAKVVKGDQYNPETEGNWLVSNVFFKNNLFLHKSSWPKEQLLQDAKPIFGDAQFANKGGLTKEDYIPQNMKLVKNKGIMISKIANDTIGIVYGLHLKKDILGNKIDSLPDLGAIEIK